MGVAQPNGDHTLLGGSGRHGDTGGQPPAMGHPIVRVRPGGRRVKAIPDRGADGLAPTGTSGLRHGGYTAGVDGERDGVGPCHCLGHRAHHECTSPG